MARYYGTIQGARGPASRQGTANTGFNVTAQSEQGDILIEFRSRGDDDHVWIGVRPHGGGYPLCLYSGPVSDLLNERTTLVERMAKQKLEEEFA